MYGIFHSKNLVGHTCVILRTNLIMDRYISMHTKKLMECQLPSRIVNFWPDLFGTKCGYNGNHRSKARTFCYSRTSFQIPIYFCFAFLQFICLFKCTTRNLSCSNFIYIALSFDQISSNVENRSWHHKCYNNFTKANPKTLQVGHSKL